MDHRTTYLSFWNIGLSNIPVGIFRRRALSTAEARSIVSAARASGTLVCVAKDDLGAPYCEKERERHRQLCALLREHADIDVHLEDFFGARCARPLCQASVGSQRSILVVVDCYFTFDLDIRAEIEATDTSAFDASSKELALRITKGSIKKSIDPESIQFYVFEQIEPDAVACNGPSDGPRSPNE
jgi:hypothetical protein